MLTAPSATNLSDRIKHVVVLMLENRSFDHIFGFYPGVDGLKGTEFNLLDPTKSESSSNPRFTVDKGASFAINVGEGPGHSLKACNYQLACDPHGPDGGRPATNTGYILNYQNSLRADHVTDFTQAMLRVPMQSFTPDKLPALNTLAQQFVLCDQWYSEVPGPTQPNRLYVHAATSQGLAYNDWRRVFDIDTIYNQIEERGLEWSAYYSDDNDVAKFSKLSAKAYTEPSEQAEWEQDRANGAKGAFFDFVTFFAAHAKAGTLANYVFIEPAFGDAGQAEGSINSMHAPHDLRPGDKLVADVYNALRANPDLFASTLLVITFDEHGGFYDHVIPPSAVNPDGMTGDESPRAPAFGFDRLGLRVPTLLVSPWLAAGKINHDALQHTSILATARKIFGIDGALTQRDAAAGTFEDLLLELGAARTDTPSSIPYADMSDLLTARVTGARAPVRADSLLAEKAAGWHSIMSSGAGGRGVGHRPKNTREAHDFMRDAVKRYSRR